MPPTYSSELSRRKQCTCNYRKFKIQHFWKDQVQILKEKYPNLDGGPENDAVVAVFFEVATTEILRETTDRKVAIIVELQEKKESVFLSGIPDDTREEKLIELSWIQCGRATIIVFQFWFRSLRIVVVLLLPLLSLKT